MLNERTRSEMHAPNRSWRVDGLMFPIEFVGIEPGFAPRPGNVDTFTVAAISLPAAQG